MTAFNHKFVAESWKIALIINNCPARPKVSGLEAKLIFLSPNATSKTQPMDQGIIRLLKAHYSAKLVAKQIVSIELKPDPILSLK